MSEKSCSNCGKELTCSLDEFGPIHEPLCIKCFFLIGDPTEEARTIEWIESGIDELEAEAESFHEDIDDLQSQLVQIEFEIRRKKEELHREKENLRIARSGSIIKKIEKAQPVAMLF